MTMTEFIFNKICTIIANDSFPDEVKDFASNSFPIISLCATYEEGTGKKINKKIVDTVINFINDCVPLMNEVGAEIHDFDDETLKMLILDFYVPVKKIYLKNPDYLKKFN